MKYQLLITYYRQQTTPKLVDRRYSLRLLFTLLLVGLGSTGINAQINVGAITPPDASAILQATSNNKGVLFPNLSATQRDAIANPAAGLVIFNTTANQLQYNAGTAANKNWQPVGNVSGQQLPLVSLTNTLLPAPLATHIKGVAVYNTATTGSGTTGVIPGIYINDGTQWRATVLATAINFAATFSAGTLDCTSVLTGNYTASIAMTATNTKTVTITATAIGPYTASTDTQNGVSFLASGNITATGSNNVILTASGTPTNSGTFTYTVAIAGQTCTFYVVYALPVATFSAGTIDCGGTLAGTYVATVAATATNTKIVNITAATLGTYMVTSDTQNGVSFSATGTITAIGSTAITFTASGTPTTSGTFTYTATIGGQTCTFSVTYAVPGATFTAGSLSCTGTLSGSYVLAVNMNATNTKNISITAATAGTFIASTDAKNGVTFSATGTIPASGSTTITLTASGTPTASGTFTYILTIAGQTCTFNVVYAQPPATFTAGSLSCNGALLGGPFSPGVRTNSSKAITIFATSLGTYTATSNTQNGVTFTKSGTITTLGANTIVLTSLGYTATNNGTFTYTISIGGQTCTFDILFQAHFTFIAVNTQSGSYYVGYPMTAANTQLISYNTDGGGIYTATTDVQNGVSFSSSGTLPEGSSSFNMVATGTPIAGGTFTYTATVNGLTTTFTVTYIVPVATFTAGTFNCGGVLSGGYYLNTAMDITNTKQVNVTAAQVGSYTLASNEQNGVSFSASGFANSAGNLAITLTATGTPIATGTFTYGITLYGGQNCIFNVTYTLPPAIYAANTIDCSGTLSGNYVINTAMAQSNTKAIRIGATTTGSYNMVTNTQNGVYFSAVGNIAATGTNTITLVATGTPTTTGTFTYIVNIGGQTCSFDVTFLLQPATFTTNSLVCGGALSGAFAKGRVTTADNTKIITITATTVGAFTATTNVQNGVSFSAAGTVIVGSNNISLIATGTPTDIGAFTYSVTIAGQTCTFSVTYAGIPATFTTGTIDCSGIITGNYVINTPMVSGNTKVVNIGADITGSYYALTNTQNGVYFLASGNITATGFNSLTFYASGTPAASGTFTYNVSVGGQTCSFNVTYALALATFATNTIDCSGTLSGTYYAYNAVAATNTKVVNITVSTPGSYTAITDTKNGVSFSSSGVVTATGSTALLFTASGTPIASGTFVHTLTIGGQTCNFSITYSVPTAVFTTNTLVCSGTLSGNYLAGVVMASSNVKTIAINTIIAGSYTASTDVQNGVSFSATGVLTTTGITTINLVGSGTPTTEGTFTYTVSLGGQTCTFSVTYNYISVTSIDCSSVNVGFNGNYNVGVAMTSTNTWNINVTTSSVGGYYFSSPVVDGFSFSGSGVFTHTGVNLVTLKATGTMLAWGTYNFPVSGNGQSCNYNVTFTGPVATFTAGTIDCGGALAGIYNTSVSLSAANTKTITITTATVGTYSTTTDTQNGVNFSVSGESTTTGPTTITLVGSGYPSVAGTFTYTVTLKGQTCTFPVTYTPKVASFAPGTLACGGALTGTYTVGLATAATNTKTITITPTSSGVYTASTNTLNGVSFSAVGTNNTIGLTTFTLVASGTPLSTGTFTYTVTLGGQTCTFDVAFLGATFTANTIACTGLLAGNYNAGVDMAATNTKTVTITAATTGSYTSSTNTLNGVSFYRYGSTEGPGSMAVTMVASGTPLAAGTFTYTTTIAGQTCTFDVVFANDKLRAAFSSVSCASCTAYDAAAVNTWVPVTAAEYAALASTTNVASAAVYGTTEANMTSGTAAYPSSTGNQTTLALQLPTVANTYLYALSMEVATSTANQGFQVKAVPVATPTTTITNVPSTGVFATIVTAIAARTRVYFVLKQPTTAVAAASYVGGWPPTNMALQYGPLLGAANARYYGAGNVTTGLALAANSFRVQLLGTVTKQW